MKRWMLNSLLILMTTVPPAAYGRGNPAYEATNLIQEDRPSEALKILNAELRLHPNNKDAYQSRG